MEKNCKNCVNYRNDDGCRWCELGHTCSSKINCSAWAKRLTSEEVQRVTDLMQVWQHLYDTKAYHLCDIISREIGVIKCTIESYNEEL